MSGRTPMLGLFLGIVLAVLGMQSSFLVAKESHGETKPAITYVMKFGEKNWRRHRGEYKICPGEYRDYFGKVKCRVQVSAGGSTREAKERSVKEAIELQTGQKVDVSNIGTYSGKLEAVYYLPDGAKAMEGKPTQTIEVEYKVTDETAGTEWISYIPLIIMIGIPALGLAVSAFTPGNSSNSGTSYNSNSSTYSDTSRRTGRRVEPRQSPPSINTLAETTAKAKGEAAPRVIAKEKAEVVEVIKNKRKVVLD